MGPKRIILKAFPGNAGAARVYREYGFREYARADEDIRMEIFTANPGLRERPLKKRGRPVSDRNGSVF